MKTTSKLVSKTVLAGIATLFVLTGGVNNLWAHEGDWDEHHHYYRNAHGYWDDDDHYAPFIIYHEHHGYWDTRVTPHVFINVD